MKKSIIILCFTALLAGGCESYLDRQPDESYTSGNIFEKYSSTFAYLVNVYSWIFNETDPSGQQNHLRPLLTRLRVLSPAVCSLCRTIRRGR